MGIETALEKTPFLPVLDWVVNWGRKYSIWPVTLVGLMRLGDDVTSSATWDISRLDPSLPAFAKASRSHDCAGPHQRRMAPWLSASMSRCQNPNGDCLCVCACSRWDLQNHSVVQGVDQIIPVDIYVRLSPRPESLLTLRETPEKKSERVSRRIEKMCGDA